MLAIEKIEGRSDDVLKFKSITGQEVNIYPDYVRRAVILADESITEYQVVQKGANEMGLFTNGSEQSFGRAQKALSDFLLEKNVSNVRIQQLNNIVQWKQV
jgi:phenylacetate-coenzyme A ligase PaaK-like adenylate-forming protein